jgi:hypothetical protein
LKNGVASLAYSRLKNGVASLAYSRLKNGVASLAYSRLKNGVASLAYDPAQPRWRWMDADRRRAVYFFAAAYG